MQHRAIEEISGTEGAAYTQSLETIREKNPEVSNFLDEGDTEKRPLQELITKEDFCAIPETYSKKKGCLLRGSPLLCDGYLWGRENRGRERTTVKCTRSDLRNAIRDADGGKA